MKPSEKTTFLAHSLNGQHKKMVSQAMGIIEQSISICENPFVTCSWGKDSVVMLHLVQSVLPSVTVVHVANKERDLISNFSEVEAQYQKKIAYF